LRAPRCRHLVESNALQVTPPAPLDPLVRRLGLLDGADQRALCALPIVLRSLYSGEEIFSEGASPAECCVVLEGVLSHAKMLRDGRRQLVSLHLRGEIADVTGVHLRHADYTLTAHSPARVALIRRTELLNLMAHHPNVAMAIMRESQICAAIHREWAVSLGRRSAYERLAHLCCELATRSWAAGTAGKGVFERWFTQVELADLLGLSPVHVNRSVQLLKAQGLIAIRGRTLSILDWPRLAGIANFDPAYLHMTEQG
jgi:CRP-like cAMP-binding protein